jgi:hypothetical protein
MPKWHRCIQTRALQVGVLYEQRVAVFRPFWQSFFWGFSEARVGQGRMGADGRSLMWMMNCASQMVDQ